MECDPIHHLDFDGSLVDWSGLFLRGLNFAEEFIHCSFNEFSLEILHLLRGGVLGDRTIGILSLP